MIETATNIEWWELTKMAGFYIGYFLFYVILIQTTLSTIVSTTSSIFYKDVKSPMSGITAASVLWSIYILLHHVQY